MLFDSREYRQQVKPIKVFLQSDYNTYHGFDLSPCFHILCYTEPLTAWGGSKGLCCTAA